MGLIESREQRRRNANESWKVANISLSGKVIQINKKKYQFGSHQLGSGAFGTVYPARRQHDGGNVAIKVVSLAENSAYLPALAQSFLNEVRQSNRLSSQSKHVVQMHDFDFDRSSGLAFIVMERGDQDLEKTLSNKSILTIHQQKNLWRQILNVVITLHQHSIVHLDIKPSNLVFFGNRLKLVDLGIAQKANTRGNGPTGTFGFSAPEVRIIPADVLPRYTPKADIWSIGAILYWINYGHAPLYDRRNKSYRPPMGIPSSQDRNVVDILQHTLHMDPHQRPHTKWLSEHPFTRSS